MDLLVVISLIFAFILFANWVEKRDSPPLYATFQFVMALFNLPALLIGAAFLLAPASTWQKLEPLQQLDLDWNNAGIWLLMMGMWGLLVALPPFRALIAQITPTNAKNAVHAAALMLAGYLVGNTFLTLGQGGLEELVDSAISVSIWQIIGQQMLFALAGLLGVGWLIRRHRKEIFHRLGLERPTLNQLLVAAGITGFLVVVQIMAGAAAFLLEPDQFNDISNLNDVLLGEIDSPIEAILLAAATGLGEEILFRGALQPVLGLPLTTILFTLAHIQYGFSLITLFLLFLATVLCLVRKYSNTTTAILIHASYNFTLLIMAILATQLQHLLPEYIR